MQCIVYTCYVDLIFQVEFSYFSFSHEFSYNYILYHRVKGCRQCLAMHSTAAFHLRSHLNRTQSLKIVCKSAALQDGEMSLEAT